MSTPGLQVPAFAKINLTLEIIGRRSDGYHDVATILQSIDLADTLTIEPAGSLTVECDNPDLDGQRNLIWRAAAALADHAGIRPNAHLHLTKRIPVAAGLGGGSTDAASALRGLNDLWQLQMSRVELAKVAAGIGSDVPFCIDGGTALATGRGDQLIPLPPLPPHDVLLVVPRETLESKTPTLFAALEPGDFSDGSYTQRISSTITDTSITSGQCRNAFERAALEIFPGLSDVWHGVAGLVKHAPRLSGAGPSFFSLPSTEIEYTAVQSALRNTGATAYLVRTI